MSCTKIAETTVIYRPDQLMGSTGSTSVGTTVQLSCLEGYKLDGASSLTCQSNRQWSGTVPKCVTDVPSNLTREETIVIAVVCAAVGLVLLGLLVLCICYHMKKKRRHYYKEDKVVHRYPKGRHDRRNDSRNDSRNDYIYSKNMDRGSIHSAHSVPGMKWYNDYGRPGHAQDYYSLDRAHLSRGQVLAPPVNYPTYDRYYDDYDGYSDGYAREQRSSFKLPRSSYSAGDLYYGSYGRY